MINLNFNTTKIISKYITTHSLDKKNVTNPTKQSFYHLKSILYTKHITLAKLTEPIQQSINVTTEHS